MTLCSGGIIANSTMSWWGAWLMKDRTQLIIYPSRWFGSYYDHYDMSDLFPKDWIGGGIMNLTFLMPCRIESEDRLRNVISSVGYLAKHFPQCKIIVKEVDKKSVFRERVIPHLTNLFGGYPQNIIHLFEESQDAFFHKTKILNDLLLASDTDIIFNYDVDVVYPLSSYETGYKMITEGGYDAVYTFGCGIYQWAVSYDEPTFDKFLKSGFDASVLDEKSTLQPSVMGWGQMIKRQVQIDAVE